MKPSDLGKALYLNAGYTAFGYYQPTLAGNSDQTFPLRNTIWTSAMDIYLGVIEDYNQADLDRSLSATFVEYRTPEGELRYVRSDVTSFNSKFDIVELPAADINQDPNQIDSKVPATNRLSSIVVLGLKLALAAIAGLVGYKVYKKYKNKQPAKVKTTK
jgi:hypothetical protein